jgi:copper(I)-binding protein
MRVAAPKRTLSVVTALLAWSLFGTSFATASDGATPGGHSKIAARVGHLEVIDPFLPDPASPSVASIYLTIKNTGSEADALVSVSSPVSSDSMLMRENGPDSSMAMLKELRIPGHGEASLKPGHDHLMLEQPKLKFKVGKTVLVTLRFEKSGSVTVKVPVVPLSRILSN